jgi:hypothetical protein
MRKTIMVAVLAAAVVLVGGAAMAGRGYGPGDGSGPLFDCTAGTPFEYTGDVVTAPTTGSGQGMVIATADQNITIYGLGPFWYWTQAGVDRPAVGDTVTVSGYIVNYNGTERNIAVLIQINEASLQLRDPSSCMPPLWSRQGRNN